MASFTVHSHDGSPVKATIRFDGKTFWLQLQTSEIGVNFELTGITTLADAVLEAERNGVQITHWINYQGDILNLSKSTIAIVAAKRRGDTIEDIKLSVIDPKDLRGIPETN